MSPSIPMASGWRRVAAAAWLGLSAVTTQAEELRVALPDRSRLVLDLPAGWSAQLRPSPASASAAAAAVPPAPDTIHLSPSSGTAFRVIVTPIWRDNLGVPLPTRADLRARVRVAADAATARSVEREIPLRDFAGPGVHGAYFTATDRAPPPGDYARMAQGMAGFGEIVLAFTLLSNEDPAPPLATTLQMLTGVRREVGGR